MRILGIDPGLRKTGFGVLEQHQGRLHYVASGTIVVPTEEMLSIRLKIILDEVRSVVQQYQVDQCAIEHVFVNTNPKTTLLLGQARGAAICAMADMGLLVQEYTALQIKKSVVGRGHASKEQVQLMVKNLLSLSDLPSPDAADALACAICHAHASPLMDKVSDVHEMSMQGGRIHIK